jgi:hypothetical protein
VVPQLSVSLRPLIQGKSAHIPLLGLNLYDERPSQDLLGLKFHSAPHPVEGAEVNFGLVLGWLIQKRPILPLPLSPHPFSAL